MAERSWKVDSGDLWGRTLPQQGYSSHEPSAGAFVNQDNTSKVMSLLTGDTTLSSSGTTGSTKSMLQLPSSFTPLRGTLLSDAVTKGDVEAVFSGLASVCTLQTWPCGHPFALRDELMVTALIEDAKGLPAWLAME